ncbi:MAG TPA: MaoC family dehydratase [Alphaproteobacteria bacterium]|nr:MaoC family dehydratase [Alphaproteobacteria bacterium]
MRHVFNHPSELKNAVGMTFGPTDWLVVDQKRIDMFADATGDHQWIHVDPERAKSGPYGATIAHGYLTLALVNLFLPDLHEVRGISMGVNYGVEKVRFPSVVRAGSRIRGRGEMISVEERPDGSVQSILRVTVEIEGSDRPACVADTISRWFPA